MGWCIMRMRSVINFGKYMGKSVKDVLEIDYKYIAWAIDNTNSFPCQEVVDYLLGKDIKVSPQWIVKEKSQLTPEEQRIQNKKIKGKKHRRTKSSY